MFSLGEIAKELDIKSTQLAYVYKKWGIPTYLDKNNHSYFNEAQRDLLVNIVQELKRRSSSARLAEGEREHTDYDFVAIPRRKKNQFVEVFRAGSAEFLGVYSREEAIARFKKLYF